MDFGFGSLVDKFEEYVGRRPTRLLLWLAAVAAFVVCIRTIITEGILPIAVTLRAISSDSAFALFQKVGVGVFIASASGLVFFGIVRLLLARAVTQAGEHVSHAERVVARAEAGVSPFDSALGLRCIGADDVDVGGCPAGC